MTDPVDHLAEAGHKTAYVLWSALDGYFGSRGDGLSIAHTEATLPQLAGMPGELEFPGSEWADVIWHPGESSVGILLRCVDVLDESPPSMVVQGRLLRMPGKARYRDPFDCYPELRKPLLHFEDSLRGTWLDAAEIAIYLSRYEYALPVKMAGFEGPRLLPGEQRILLMLMLGGVHPAPGLRFLLDCGFIGEHWPLLEEMGYVEQSKDFHPEGNVWDHTLETLSHRKRPDAELGLALLLHDCGKAAAEEHEGNRFHRHAQIGAARAVRFLRSLDFEDALVERIRFLINNHMVPSFLRAIPSGPLADVLGDPLFPDLLEMYRCDIMSSFRGPDAYYRACKVYRAFMKRRGR
jgi:poly(A) polymerase